MKYIEKIAFNRRHCRAIIQSKMYQTCLSDYKLWQLLSHVVQLNRFVPILNHEYVRHTLKICYHIHYIITQNWEKTGSCDGLVLDITKLLRKPMLLISSDVPWHALEGNFTGNTHDIYLWHVFENYQFKSLRPSDAYIRQEIYHHWFT